MSAEKLAKRYAKAVIAIAEEKKELKTISNDTDVLTYLADNHEAMSRLMHPKIELKEKANHLVQFCKKAKCTQTIQNTLLLMLKKNHLGILDQFLEQLTILSDSKLNRMRIKITVPAEKDIHYSADIQKILTEKTKCDVIAETVIDPAIIGGLVLQTGSYIFDGSIQNKLDSLTKSFI